MSPSPRDHLPDDESRSDDPVEPLEAADDLEVIDEGEPAEVEEVVVVAEGVEELKKVLAAELSTDTT